MASTRIVSITDISSSGEGIAKVDGMIYFVSGAVPLQTVEARIVEEKKRYVRANFVRLIEDNATSRPYWHFRQNSVNYICHGKTFICQVV